jgi:glutamate racemase
VNVTAARKSSSPVRRPIGVFDSGVGGLTVVRQLHRLLPAEDIVYLGDTARVPYGTKSPPTIVRFACEDARFLLAQRVKAVVVACNTASALALDVLERKFDLPVFGVIGPGAQAAVRRTRNHRIGVIATSSTIRSGAYERAIRRADPGTKVTARACPLLVPLVEEGWLRHPVTDAVLREYLGPVLARGVDTLVLGCTHYPLLKPAIRRVTGGGVTLIDSAESCAAAVRARLGELQLLNPSARKGTIQPFVTDEPGRFRELSRRFLRDAIRPPVHIDLPV